MAQQCVKKVLILAIASNKALKPVVSTAWQYMKVEMPPPMTTEFFKGPIVKKMEDSISSAVDSMNKAMAQQIAGIDAAHEKALKDKAEAIKLALAKAKEQAKITAEKKKKEEEKKKELAAMLAKEAKEREEKCRPKPKDKKSCKVEAKTGAAKPAKKAEAKKPAAAAAAAAPAAPAAKKAKPKGKQPAKKTRREPKKGKPPKK